MSDESERLRAARELAGYDTAADAARDLDLNYQTYAGHENGNRGFDKDEARIYARKFKVNLLWLLYGQGAPKDKPLETKILALKPAQQKQVVDLIDFLAGRD